MLRPSRPPRYWRCASPKRASVWRFGADGTFTIRFDGNDWTLERGERETPDVVVDSSLEAWARFLTGLRSRTLPRRGIRLTGSNTALKVFVSAFAVELQP
jgi:hypothetical protein